MSLTGDLTFIEKNHRLIIEILAAGLLVFSVFYVKDYFHNKEIIKENATISSLNVEYAKLNAVKLAADKTSADLFNLYQQEHAKLISTLSKKPVVTPITVTPNSTLPAVSVPSLPNIPVPTNLTDCQQDLAAVQADDIECNDTVNALQSDKVVDQNVINNQAQTIINVDVENTQLKQDVATQTTRKKLWRDSALVELLVILAHFL